MDNTFGHDGGYGNPTNGDFEQLNFEAAPTDCFAATPTPTAASRRGAALQQSDPCRRAGCRRTTICSFLNEVLCDSRVSAAVRLPAR